MALDVELEALHITEGLETATLPKPQWTHRAHVLAAVTLVRRHGPAEALARLRLAIPRYNEATGVANTDSGGYHDTITVFYVWAVDRLVSAGLSTTAILWHPLTGFEAVSSWYDPATLWSVAARRSFVPSNLARAGEPAPHDFCAREADDGQEDDQRRQLAVG